MLQVIVNITGFQEIERKGSEEQLLKCKEEIIVANSMIVKKVSEKEKGHLPVGKELLDRVAGLGKVTESKFREWRNLLLVSARCMDEQLYDAIMKLDDKGK